MSAGRLVVFAALLSFVVPTARADRPSYDELIKTAVDELVKMQEDDGAWPYEGVYRVAGEIPVGYRIGGTAIVCEALLHSPAGGEERVRTAIERGVACILTRLDDELMAPSTKDAYDVRVWGHSFALEIFCQLRAAGRLGKDKEKAEAWIPKLIAALVTEELPEGGWNYASRRAPASFVTAPVTQALLLARSQGERVPDDVFTRARSTLESEREESGLFQYSGRGRRAASQPASAAAPDEAAKNAPTSAPATQQRSPTRVRPDQLPGSIARSAICETTLVLLGGGSREHVKAAIDAFHRHWDELEKRRKKTGTHEGPYAIAPYYFYYGHRYAAQAINMLPLSERAAERDRLLDVILRTRDEDGTWNDRVFPRSRNFGTAMIVLALLGEKDPMPPALKAD